MGIIRRTRSKARPPRSSRGFSLIEMLVTLAVLAIVIGLASPLFTTMTNRNRLTGAANETVAAFQIARSEAIRRNVRTVICESVDSVTCRNGSPCLACRGPA